MSLYTGKKGLAEKKEILKHFLDVGSTGLSRPGLGEER
jgi:hypothetical protein